MPGPMNGGGPGGPGGSRRPGGPGGPGGPRGPMGGPRGPRGPMPPPPRPYGGFRRRPYGYGCLGWCLALLAGCSGIILLIGMLLF